MLVDVHPGGIGARVAQRVRDDCLPFRPLHVSVGEGDLEILGDGEVVEQMVLLEDEADILFVECVALFELESVHGVIVLKVLTLPVGVEHADDAE